MGHDFFLNFDTLLNNNKPQDKQFRDTRFFWDTLIVYRKVLLYIILLFLIHELREAIRTKSISNKYTKNPLWGVF